MYSGDDYKRALEAKMRGMRFTTDSSIQMFCNELRVVITELFGLKDAAVVKKLAINDVLSLLDPSAREHLKVLQLEGTCL